MQQGRLEGRSLSLCIRDILGGAVAEQDISRIVASTAAHDRPEFLELIDDYARLYWGAKPEEGKAIALRFYDDGKIDQPRLRGEPYPNISQGHWKVIEYSAAAQTPLVESWGKLGLHDSSLVTASGIAQVMKDDLYSAIENGVPDPKSMRVLKFKPR